MVRFSIHEDLLIEILTKLPVKQLFRFSCISKSWNSLFSDDYFLRRIPLLISAIYYSSSSSGSNSSSKQPKHAFVCENGFVESTSMSFLPSASTIIDSCNGLLLTVSSENSKQYYVCNPLTKRWTSVPVSSKENLLSILSYNGEAEAFKVIGVTEWRPQGAILNVFCSFIGEWKEHEVHWEVDSGTISPVMHRSNGTLYILSYPNHVVCVNTKSFNKFSDLIELPERVKHEGLIGSNGGKLHYAVGDGSKYNVWMMEESNKWVLKCSFSLRDFGEEFEKQSSRCCSFVGFHPEEEMVYLFVNGKLISYDLKRGRVREVCRFGDGEKENVYLIQLGVFPFSDCRLQN